MKKLVFVLATASVLSACSTTEKFDKRAETQYQRETKQAEAAVDKAPKWMSVLPESTEAVYANGTALSRDYGMAANKAKTVAYGKICMAAGGKVDQQTKVYMMDSESSGTEMSETAIRSMCPGVDITGIETVEVKTIAEGPRFRSFVLVALPTGESNKLQARKDRISAQKRSVKQADRAFTEMDNRKPEAE
jgi:hypothetical protein